MTTRAFQIAVAFLVLAVAAGLLYLRVLHRRVQRLEQMQSEEMARREVTQPPVVTPTDVKTKAKLFWASTTTPGALQPVEAELSLSADPVQRAKQVLHVLLYGPPSPDERTLPAGAALLGFYILPDGTAVADFSDQLASETPSGILSEKLAVDSIARTLAANVPNLRRLKILIRGQEAETLAGHIDLIDSFPLQPPAAAASGTPALTPPGGPGKLTGERGQ